MKNIHVFSPATVANVACGFDIFGFAIETPGDELVVKLKETPGVILSQITGDNGRLPFNPIKNTAAVSVIKYLEYLNSKQGVEIELHKKMPLGSGLGSSAASSAGSLFAVNILMGSPLSHKELIPFAMEGERVACGTAHADNVAPALLGGFVLIRSYSPLDVMQIPSPLNFYCTIIHPRIEVPTKVSRKLLNRKITMQQHVIQTGNIAGLIFGLVQGDVDLIHRSLQDVIAEPVRSSLIPGFDRIKAAAINKGALGCSISGSGPSLFALSCDHSHAQVIGSEMMKACIDQGIEYDIYISPINYEGCKVLS